MRNTKKRIVDIYERRCSACSKVTLQGKTVARPRRKAAFLNSEILYASPEDSSKIGKGNSGTYSVYVYRED